MGKHLITLVLIIVGSVFIPLISLAALDTASNASTQTTAPTPPHPLSEDIRSAWKNAGFESGWMNAPADPAKRNYMAWDNSVDGRPGEIPAMRVIMNWQPNVISKLPVPDQGFGLVLVGGNHGPLITDLDLKELSGFKHLQSLKLLSAGITDAGLKELAGFDELRALDLAQTKVTDAGLKELMGLLKLDTLILDDCAVTGAGLKNLSGLPLRTLVISGDPTPLTEDGINGLVSFTQLQTLDLGSSHMMEPDVAKLAALTELRTLNFNHIFPKEIGIHVQTSGVAAFAAMKHLQYLDISDTPTHDADLMKLSGLTELRSLFLSNVGITDYGVTALVNMKELRTLSLEGTAITEIGLKELAGLTQLQSLNLWNDRRLTDDGLIDLAGFTELQYLNLSGVPITDAGLKELAGLKKLKTLNVQFTKVTTGAVDELQKALPALRDVQLGEGR